MKNSFPSANTVIVREASVDDDDDDDEFQSYDYSHDTVKADAPKPSYIRTCLADLMATDKIPQLEAALQVLPSLLDMYKIECEEVALELVRILLNYNSDFSIDAFQVLQLNGLVALCGHYPLLVSDYLCKQFYEKNYTLTQRSLILKTIQETGRKLSELEQLRTKVQHELRVSDADEEVSDDDGDAWRSIIAERLKLKTKHRFQRRSVKQRASKENHFGTIVGHFFYPLMAFIDRSTAHLALIDGDQEHLLLCELLACLGRLCIHAQNTFVLVAMIKQFWQVLQSLQQHQDPGVRHAVVYAYACCLVSLGQTCADEELQMNLIELKQWLDMIISKDTNTEVQKLARSTRQILLRTLQEITTN